MAWRFDRQALLQLFWEIQKAVWNLEHDRGATESEKLSMIRKLGIVAQEMAKRGIIGPKTSKDFHDETQRHHEKRIF